MTPSSRQRIPWLLAALLIIIAILNWRRPDAFTNPQLWAEDGNIFLQQAYQSGSQTFFTPYAGYYHTLARIIAIFDKAIPIQNVSQLHVFGSLFFLLTIPLLIFSNRLQMPNWVQLLMAISLVIAPINNESFLNLANISFLSGVLLPLMAILDPPSSNWGKIGHLLMLAVVGLSTPFTIVLWLLFLANYIWDRTTYNRNQLMAGLAVALIQVLNMGGRASSGGLLPELSLDYFATVGNVIANRTGYFFLGKWAYVEPNNRPIFLSLALLFLTLYALIGLRAYRTNNQKQGLIWLAPPLTIILSLFVNRHYPADNLLHTGRHAVIPSITFLWTLLLANRSKFPFEKIAVGLILFNFFFLTPELKNKTWPDLKWAEQVEQCKWTFTSCSMQINPVRKPPWTVRLQLDSHTFEKPKMETAVSINFDNKIQLHGYTLNQQEIELVFASLTPMKTSYKYFLHLIAEESADNIHFQTDSIPLNWKYPTDQWLDGEFITETVQLPEELENGRYKIRIGWYDDAGRLPIEGQPDGFIVLPDELHIE